MVTDRHSSRSAIAPYHRAEIRQGGATAPPSAGSQRTDLPTRTHLDSAERLLKLAEGFSTVIFVRNAGVFAGELLTDSKPTDEPAPDDSAEIDAPDDSTPDEETPQSADYEFTP